MSGLPEGWEIKSLGELSKVKRGASPRPIKNPKWWGGDVGWVRISDVTASTKYLTKTKNKLSDEGVSKSVRIKKGELILSICATIGRPIIVDTDACIHDGFVWFENLSQEVSREYFYYFLSAQEKQLSNSRQIGTQGNLNTDIVSRLQFPLPPLPEQQKIANILSTVDEKIALIDNQIDETETLKKGLMQKLLTEGIGHSEFKDSEVGRIPVGWGVTTIGESCKNFDGQRVPLKSEDRQLIQGKYPYYGAQGIIDYINNYIFDGEYLLVAEDGENVKGQKYDIAFMVKGKFWINNHAHILQSTSNMNLYFISNILNHINIIKYVTGTGQPKLNKAQLNLIKIPLPPLTEQTQIAQILSTTDEKLQILRDKKEAFQNLKKGLMQKLLTGEIRVIV